MKHRDRVGWGSYFLATPKLTRAICGWAVISISAWEGAFALPFYQCFVSCSPVPDLWYCGGLPRPLGRNAGSIVKKIQHMVSKGVRCYQELLNSSTPFLPTILDRGGVS